MEPITLAIGERHLTLARRPTLGECDPASLGRYTQIVSRAWQRYEGLEANPPPGGAAALEAQLRIFEEASGEVARRVEALLAATATPEDLAWFRGLDRADRQVTALLLAGQAVQALTRPDLSGKS